MNAIDPSRARAAAMPHEPADAGAGWPAVLVIVGAGIVSAFQVGKAPVALDAVQADLGLGLAVASWLLSAFAVVGALGGVVIGVGVDRFGARGLAVGGLLLQAAAGAIGTLAEGAPLLLATRAVEGVGFLAVVVAAPVLIVAATAPRDRGRAMAVWACFMPLGIGIVMLGASLLAVVGWRGYWLVNAGVLLAYAGLLAAATRAIAAPAAPRRPLAADVRRTLAAGGPWLLFGLFALFSVAFFAVFGFLPVILSQRLGVTPETAGLLSAAAIAINAVGNLACGPLLARGVPRRHILVAAFVAMGLAGFGVLGGALSGWGAYALCVAFSVVAGLIPTALIDAAPRQAPAPALVGATVGLTMQGNNVGLLVGPAAAGALAAAFGWPLVAPLVAVAALAAAALALLLGRRERP